MLERLKRRLELVGNDRDELLGDLLEEAEQYILGYTGRRVLPMALEGAVIETAAASFRLLGLEGAASHAEGGVNDVIDRLPARMRAQLDMFRLGRVLCCYAGDGSARSSSVRPTRGGAETPSCRRGARWRRVCSRCAGRWRGRCTVRSRSRCG